MTGVARDASIGPPPHLPNRLFKMKFPSSHPAPPRLVVLCVGWGGTWARDENPPSWLSYRRTCLISQASLVLSGPFFFKKKSGTMPVVVADVDSAY